MRGNKAILALLEKRCGYLTTKQAKESGISNTALQRAVEQGLIERVAQGLYISSDVFPDPYIVAQHKCPKGIFSHETALFLHDLSDRVPLQLMITIPTGWNSNLLTSEEFHFFYCKPALMTFGVCDVTTPSGVKIRAFDLERTLCDCLRSEDKLDRDLVLSAIKQYLKSGQKDNAKLLAYADKFKLRDTVYRYMEVLS